MELIPCPFCESTNINPDDFVSVGKHIVYFCSCDACGAEGSAANTKEEAVVKWNTRAQTWPPMQTGEPPKDRLFLVIKEPAPSEWFEEYHKCFWDGSRYIYRVNGGVFKLRVDEIIGWWPLPPMGGR